MEEVFPEPDMVMDWSHAVDYEGPEKTIEEEHSDIFRYFWVIFKYAYQGVCGSLLIS